MNILLVSDFFPTGKDLRFSGGVEARTFFIAKYLAKKNTVHVITSRQIGSKRQERLFGFTVHRVGIESSYVTGNISISFLPKKISFIYCALKKASKLDLDIIDGCDYFGHFISKLVSFKKKIPAVFWYADVFIGQWVKTSGIFAGLGGYILEKINLSLNPNHFIAISNQTRSKLIKNHIHKEKVSVIPCGVDLKEFEPPLKNKKMTNILSIGRLVWYKRLKDLVLAFALISKSKNDLNLEIIGRGPELHKLSNLVQNLRINKKVKILQNLKRTELIKAIKESTIFCLTSEIEGFGISVIEAAAAGVPFVVSDLPVFKEITKNGKGGLFHKVGDIRDLSKKIEMLLNGKKLYNQKVSEGLSLAQHYPWQKIGRQTEHIYKKVIEES